MVLNNVVDNMRVASFRLCETIPLRVSVKINQVVNNFHWHMVLKFDCRPVNLCITASSFHIRLCHEAAGSCC
jgi:hypothetical protein